MIAVTLDSSEEPDLVLHHGAPQLGGDIPKLGTMVGKIPKDGILLVLGVRGGQALCLKVGIEVAVELVPSRLGNNVDDRSLHVAILGGGAQGQDLHLFDDVRAGIGPSRAAGGSRQVGAGELIRGLVRVRAEKGGAERLIVASL